MEQEFLKGADIIKEQFFLDTTPTWVFVSLVLMILILSCTLCSCVRTIHKVFYWFYRIPIGPLIIIVISSILFSAFVRKDNIITLGIKKWVLFHCNLLVPENIQPDICMKSWRYL